MSKICILLPAHWDAMKGGAEYQADILAGYIKEKTKHEVVYLARYVADSDKKHEYEICRIPSLIPEKYGLFWDSISLYNKLSDINPDIIFQHVGCAYTGISAFFCKRRKKTLIWLIASDVDVEEKTLSASIKRWPTNVDNVLLTFGIKNATYILAQTQSQVDMLQLNYNLPAYDIISNFHPMPESFENTTRQNESNQLHVYWVANIKKLKQPEIFIKLANDCEKYINIKFFIIGRKERSEWCDELFKKINQSSNIDYIGELDIEGVNKQLENAHLLVNTSLYEGFPNTFIQAWMREVPTLSLNVDPDGIIEKNKLGLHAGTYDNMKKYILYMSENIDEIHQIGKRAKSYAETYFSMKNADMLIDIIDTDLEK